MPCYQKAKNDLNQRKNLGMGWVRQGGWHTAPSTVWCTVNTAASMGPFVGVFCTVPEAPSEADRCPTGVVVTRSLAHSLLVLLPPWLTSPTPHDVSWEDPPRINYLHPVLCLKDCFRQHESPYIQRLILPPGDIWQNLDTFLVLTTGGRGAIGMGWVGTRDVTKYLQCIGKSPTIRIIQLKISVVSGLGDSALENLHHGSHTISST